MKLEALKERKSDFQELFKSLIYFEIFNWNRDFNL
jgi:hypothetical protein